MRDALDLFRGAGGWSEATRALGITDLGVENSRSANATAEAAGHRTVAQDVWLAHATVEPTEGQTASPPCQSFSVTGNGAGRQALDKVLALVPQVPDMDMYALRVRGRTEDPRTSLVLTPLWYALHRDPQWIAWEQVSTILPVWEACAEVLRAHGWHVWTGDLHAEQYGVPQTRKRAFLLGSRNGEVQPPVPTHSRYYPRSPDRIDPGVEKWVTMAEALDWPEDITVLSNYSTHGDYDKRGVRTGDQPFATVTSKVDRFRIQYPEWGYNRPATTVVGTFQPETIAAPGWRTTVSRQNADASVRVSPVEAGILQTFPKDYPWRGRWAEEVYLQVGNAVPPLLARHVLQAVSTV